MKAPFAAQITLHFPLVKVTSWLETLLYNGIRLHLGSKIRKPHWKSAKNRKIRLWKEHQIRNGSSFICFSSFRRSRMQCKQTDKHNSWVLNGLFTRTYPAARRRPQNALVLLQYLIKRKLLVSFPMPLWSRGRSRQARKSASNHYQHEFAVAIVRRSILESSLIISEKHANINLEKQITKMRILLLHFREILCRRSNIFQKRKPLGSVVRR